MFNQITATYGKPTPAALLQNDTLFRSMYSPNDAPGVLFRRIKDCQEVQILGEDPYTAQQLLNNAVRLLLQCGLYARDFEDWDQKPSGDRIGINLKTFIQAWADISSGRLDPKARRQRHSMLFIIFRISAGL